MPSHTLSYGEGPRSQTTMKKYIKPVAIILGITVFVVLLGVAIGVPLSKRSQNKGILEADFDSLTNEQKAIRVLTSVPLLDGHNDLPYLLRKVTGGNFSDFTLDQDMQNYPGVNLSHTDIPRIRRGRLGAQFWVAYVDCKSQYKDALAKAIGQLDIIHRLVEINSADMQLTSTADEIEAAFKDGKIASIPCVEGGHMVDNDFSNLRMFARYGVRYLTITHSCNTDWADNWKADKNSSFIQHKGLTEWGKKLILELNRLGIVPDLSHVSVATMNAVFDVTESPVMFSHTSAFAICPHHRNAPDEILKRVIENKSVVMVNFYNKYINCTKENRYEEGNRRASLEQVVEHIEHIRNVAGVDYVGIGGDYDGVPETPDGLEDVATYPALFTRLAERKWSEEDMKKLAGLNILRVLRKNEEVSKELKKTMKPVDDKFPTEDETEKGCSTEFI